MAQADIGLLTTIISGIARASVLSKHVAHVSVKPDQTNEGDDFLEVVVELDTFRGIADDDLIALIEAIEDSVADLDERYPSVRFPDAA